MYERRSMEQIVSDMIRWTRGTTSRITDFRVGSKARTLYESVGVIVEGWYDRTWRAMRALIEDNIYAVIGFDKRPATYARGIVRASRSTPATDNLYIQAGTELLSRASQYRAPTKYRTTEDALLQVGHTFVDIPVVADVSGEDGNTGAGNIVEFVNKPTGVDSVTNPLPIEGGKPEETKEEQKSRFQAFIEANARGILQSVEYGAETATVMNDSGEIIERVLQAKAIEYLPERRGEIDVYIWNGTGEASEELISEVQKISKGYYEEDGTPVYGYKAGGIILNVYTAPIRYVTIKLEITPEDWSTSEELEPMAEQAVALHFSGKNQGAEFIQTALEAEIKFLEGMKDVKLYISTDGGETFTTDNVVTDEQEVIMVEEIVFNRGVSD